MSVRRIAALFLAVCGAVSVTTAIASPAQANSEVCVAGRDVAYACNNVSGSGGRVDRVQAIMTLPKKANICDYSARVRISAFGNRNHRTWSKSGGQSCSFVRAWLDFPIHETYPVNTSFVCVTALYKGVQQGREMCIKLTGSVKRLQTMVWQTSYNGKCVDADLNAINTNGTKVQLWGCNNRLQQRWQTWSDGTIRSSYRGRCLDADLNTINGNGTKVQLWDCNGSRQQQWIIADRDSRGLTIRSAYNGRCVDADLNAINNDGAKVQLWDCNNQKHQRWRTLYF
jgi:hypothetical protein